MAAAVRRAARGKRSAGRATSRRKAESRRPAIVAVGGSAGGLEALRALLRPLPASFPAAVLVVLHLDPARPSHAAPILQGQTALSVRQAVHGERPLPGTVYLAPPDRHLELRGGRLALTRAPRVNFSRPSVDRLLSSVAEEGRQRTTAIILSGTGFDGREGIEAIHAAGGTCLVEDPATASHPGMPQAALSTGCADAVLPASRMGPYLAAVVGGRRVRVTSSAWKEALALLKRSCNLDFHGYRNETLRRRMEARIAIAGSRSAEEYVERLRRDAAELERLRSALLVKVSSFLRDPELWKLLERHGLARLAGGAAHGELRLWSAGCATGEEAYSLAMLALTLRRGARRVKVYGTDLDEPALAQARLGRYPQAALAGVPRAMVRRFFTAQGEFRCVKADLRRHVVFGRHDLLHDPPLADMDVVACRNVLIYLKPPERKEVLRRLASSLRPGGILFLGKAEGAALPGPGFERVAAGAPIFRRKPVPAIVAATPVRAPRPGTPRTRAEPMGPDREPVLFAVDRALEVTLWSRAAESFFAVRSEHALGRRLFDLLAQPPRLSRARLDAAMAGRRRSALPDLVVDDRGERRALSVEAWPLPGGTGLMFVGTPRRPAGKRPGAPVAEPDLAREDLQEHADSQQSLNEELQSRNEELETVNEELQSLNDEIQVQGDEARRATLFLTALLDAGPDVVIGCDRRGIVSYWGAPAVRRFGLSSEQALGKDLLRLVPQLDVAALRKLLRKRGGWPRASGRSKRIVRVPGGLQVSVFPALDTEGRGHGTLLRVSPT